MNLIDSVLKQGVAQQSINQYIFFLLQIKTSQGFWGDLLGSLCLITFFYVPILRHHFRV